MMKNTIPSEVTFEVYLEAFRALHPSDQSDLRRSAVQALLDLGAPEIGSSDVSCQVYSWFKVYGSFSPLVIQQLTDYYL